MLGKSKGDQVRLIQRAIEAIRNQPDLSPDAKKRGIESLKKALNRLSAC
ncbi:MAG: hypothetical protein GX182_02350 [Firmicutes bacterium]|nr:hypothetical protein [Bacillota bacterium]